MQLTQTTTRTFLFPFTVWRYSSSKENQKHHMNMFFIRQTEAESRQKHIPSLWLDISSCGRIIINCLTLCAAFLGLKFRGTCKWQYCYCKCCQIHIFKESVAFPTSWIMERRLNFILIQFQICHLTRKVGTCIWLDQMRNLNQRITDFTTWQ